MSVLGRGGRCASWRRSGHDGGDDVRLAGRLRPLPPVLSAIVWNLVAAPQVGPHLADGRTVTQPLL